MQNYVCCKTYRASLVVSKLRLVVVLLPYDKIRSCSVASGSVDFAVLCSKSKECARTTSCLGICVWKRPLGNLLQPDEDS